jgi:hypothetical protein
VAVLLLATTVFPQPLHAGNITLAWNANSETNLAGYKLYYGTTSGIYTKSNVVALVTTSTISNLVAGATYYFAATAFTTTAQESAFSTEVSWTMAGNNQASWLAQFFSVSDLNDPLKENLVWGDKADPDQDGSDNLMEYALGLDPTVSETTQQVLQTGLVDTGGQIYATLTFVRRKNDPNLQYIPEVSTDKVTFNSGPSYLVQTDVTSLGADFEVVTYQDLTPVTPTAARFTRLRVAK